MYRKDSVYLRKQNIWEKFCLPGDMHFCSVEDPYEWFLMLYAFDSLSLIGNGITNDNDNRIYSVFVTLL